MKNVEQGKNLFVNQRVFKKLLVLTEYKSGIIKTDLTTVAKDLFLPKISLLLSIKQLSKNDYIEYICDGDFLYFKITKIGMECV